MKIIDPHIDLPDLYKTFHLSQNDFYTKEEGNPANLKKLQENETDIFGCSLFVFKDFVNKSFYESTKEYYQFCQSMFGMSDKLVQVKNQKDLKAKGKDTIGYFYTLEGLECIRDDRDVEELYSLGVRMVGLTWDVDNIYACGRHSKNDRGISQKGRDLLKIIGPKKIPVDIAHMSERSVKDLEKYFDGIIVSTHSNARSVTNKRHNLTDEEIQIIVERKGIVGLFPIGEESGPNGTFEDLFAHLDYIASRWGIEYVGFTSDMFPLPEYPFIHKYEDITVMRGLQKYLLTRLTEKEVQTVMYDNWLRVIRSSL